MGARIVFFTTNNKKSLWKNFVDDYQDFREWTLNDWKNSEMKDQGELTLGQEIKVEAIDYLKNNPKIDLKTSTKILDELLTVYFGSYCDYGDGKELYELTGPMMSKWKYEKSTKLVNKKCDEQTIELWNRLNLGCSSNPKLHSSQSLSKDLIVGWWNVDEMKKMEINLSKAFPSQPDFDKWNKMRHQTDFNAKEEYNGLEYIYDILDIGIKENKEIIFYNEI
jgi:hypothetical protein